MDNIKTYKLHIKIMDLIREYDGTHEDAIQTLLNTACLLCMRMDIDPEELKEHFSAIVDATEIIEEKRTKI